MNKFSRNLEATSKSQAPVA